MIYIEERIPSKLPGERSLFISFDFNIQVKDILSQLDFRIYHKNTLEWEVPITKLSYLLTQFSKIDKIELKLYKENKKEELTITKDYKFKTKPYDYQIEGINYGLNNEKYLLLDDMGLGKTATIIWLAEVLHNTKNLEHCLVICGINSLKYNWIEEIKKHTNLDYMILGQRSTKTDPNKKYIGSLQDRVADLQKPIKEFFIVTNIETLRDDKIIRSLQTQINKIDMIVLDEAHKAKNPQSSQGKNLLKINWPKRKIALTGTILLNSPLDAYVPLKWIDSEHSTYSKFKQQYCEYGGFRGVQIIGYKNLDMLHKHISDVSIRRKKEDVLLDLPPRTFKTEYVEMNERQSKFYIEIKQGIIDEIDKVTMSPQYAMSLAARLRQATAWTGILSSTINESAKLDRTVELIDDILSQGDKVIVFSTFKVTLQELQRRLNKEKINHVLCDGDVKDNIIEERKQEFQTNPDCKVFLGTWQKIGTGHTLTAANYVIFIDTPYTDALFKQSADRAYRIGTTKNVTVITLVTKNTVDERVLDIVEGKSVLSNFVVDGVILGSQQYEFINFLLKD